MSQELRAKHYAITVNEDTGVESCAYCAEWEHGDIVEYPCDVIKVLDELDATTARFTGQLELMKAERDASRTYSQGFAARIRELTQEHAQLSETLEEVRVTLDMAVREPTFEGVERGSAKALAILNKAGLESPGASHDASVTSEET